MVGRGSPYRKNILNFKVECNRLLPTVIRSRPLNGVTCSHVKYSITYCAQMKATLGRKLSYQLSRILLKEL